MTHVSITRLLQIAWGVMLFSETANALSGNYVKFVSMKGSCKLSDIGYPPAGDDVNRKLLTSTVGKRQASILNKIAGEKSYGVEQVRKPSNVVKYLYTISLLDQEFVKRLTEISPKYALTLGILTTYSSRVIITKKPATEQLKDVVEGVFKNFTESIIFRLENMRNYLKSVDCQKKNVKREFQKMTKLWLECISENSTDANIECQKDAVKYIRKSSKKFLVYLQSKDKGLRLDENMVKKAEASLLFLRDYSFIYIVTMETLIGSYELNDTKKYNIFFKKFLKHIIDDLEIFKEYLSWTYSEIQRVHLKKNCHKTFSCNVKPIYEGTESSNRNVEDVHSCTCVFDVTSRPEKKCNATFIGRKNHKEKSAPYYYATSVDENVASSEAMKNLSMANYLYGVQLKNFLDVFWKNEIFDTASVWNDIIAKANLRLKESHSLAKNVVTDIDLMFESLDDDTFSPYFEERYRKIEQALKARYK